MSEFRAREVRIFRPYPDEVPWELLADARAGRPEPEFDPDLLRVAKHQGRVLGVYAIEPRSDTRFELMVLVVEQGYRRKGLGRWLLGHAIGLAESKGAREIVTAVATDAAGERFLKRAGFEADGTGLCLVLTPE